MAEEDTRGDEMDTAIATTDVDTAGAEPRNLYLRLGKICRSECTKHLFLSLALGQSLSILICGTAITSGLLQQQSVYIPTAQSFLNYTLLCLFYTTSLACRRGEYGILPVLRQRGWKYFILGLIDVEANYLVVKAYHYTTVTSVQLLDCFTIPVVLGLSWIILRVRYKLLHITGVLLCLLGVGALVLADVLVEKTQGDAPSKLVGDLFCLAGAALYGISNVSQEFVVRNFNRVEFLGMLGLFGSFINGIQFAILERHEIASVDFTSYHIWLPLVGFALCLFTLYSLMPTVMQHSSAAAVNLNLLSADFYALLAGLFLFHYKFHMLYFVSFGVIIIGVIVYSIYPPPKAAQPGDYREMCTEEPRVGPHLGQPTEITYHTHSSPTNRANGDRCPLQVAKFQVRGQLDGIDEEQTQILTTEVNGDA